MVCALQWQVKGIRSSRVVICQTLLLGPELWSSVRALGVPRVLSDLEFLYSFIYLRDMIIFSFTGITLNNFNQ